MEHADMPCLLLWRFLFLSLIIVVKGEDKIVFPQNEISIQYKSNIFFSITIIINSPGQ